MGSIFNIETSPISIYTQFISEIQRCTRVRRKDLYCKIANISGFLLVHLEPENHKTGFATGKSQVHFTNNMLDEFNVFLIQV